MSNTVIKVENIGKQYRLGEVGTGTLSHDLNRWWARTRGKHDPFAKIDEYNDRTSRSQNDYVWALKGINFEVKAGEVLGIIGGNGAGKSTLLKILSKVTKPSTGRILTKGRIAALLEVGTGFHPEMTGRDNVFLNGAIMGMTRPEIKRKFDEIVDFAGVERYIDTPVKRYSSGMYVRLAFAVAAHLEPEILIVDEVLAVGDAEFQKKCLGKMKDVSSKEGRTVLFVSHNLASVLDLCTRGILINQGTIEAFGNISTVVSKYSDRHSSLLFQNNSEEHTKPRIEKIRIDELELQNGNIHIEFNFNSPFELSPPIIGVVFHNSFGNPVFSTNARIHTTGFNSSLKLNKGVCTLKIDKAPLFSGQYYISCYIGEGTQDYNEYIEVLRFDYYAEELDNTKLPDQNIVGSININNCKWRVSN